MVDALSVGCPVSRLSTGSAQIGPPGPVFLTKKQQHNINNQPTNQQRQVNVAKIRCIRQSD